MTIVNPPTYRNDTVLPLPLEVKADAWAVDAACSGNPGPMEYQAIDLQTGARVFHFGPMKGTNNIGEFLAIVHALALMQQQVMDQEQEEERQDPQPDRPGPLPDGHLPFPIEPLEDMGHRNRQENHAPDQCIQDPLLPDSMFLRFHTAAGLFQERDRAEDAEGGGEHDGTGQQDAEQHV